MPAVPSRPTIQTHWRVRLQVPELLRPFDDDDLPGQEAGDGAAGGNFSVSSRTTPRDAAGFREAELGETPLSRAERRFAQERGLL